VYWSNGGANLWVIILLFMLTCWLPKVKVTHKDGKKRSVSLRLIFPGIEAAEIGTNCLFFRCYGVVLRTSGARFSVGDFVAFKRETLLIKINVEGKVNSAILKYLPNLTDFIISNIYNS